MGFSVGFIERREGETPSIEGVFRRVAVALEKVGIATRFQKIRFGNSIFGVLSNLLFFRPAAADIYHVTGHVHYIALKLPPERTVLTIHDLGILRSRTGLRRWLIRKLFFEWPVRRLRFITVISEATKRELVDVTGCPPEKLCVIGDPFLQADDLESLFNRDRPRILQVGTAPHKNLERIAEALQGIGCEFRIIGKLGKEQIDKLNELNLDYSNSIGSNDEEMAEEYRKADLVVFCSTFEGFGMPIIEAQAVGRPVITSRLEPMSDVAGDGAVLVDPFDVPAIREAIEKVIADPEFRLDLISRGRLNAKRFAPQNIAAQYRELYEEILKDAHPPVTAD